jgi:aerotolerance regulator-like protein
VIWLNPAALVALAVVAVPIVIHLLVQRRAERMAFPTLRFLQPTRLAAIRRHALDDVLLLVVRAAILAAAVAALAGPVMVTTARRQLWQRRIVRATVVDTTVEGARASTLDGARAFQASGTGHSDTSRRERSPERLALRSALELRRA